MQKAGLPYFPDYFEDNYSVILNPEKLSGCYWLYKNDSFNVFTSNIRAQDGWMVERTSDELVRFEQEMQAQAETQNAAQTQTSEESNDSQIQTLMEFIALQPDDKVADSALKLVDAYVDMLNSTDSGEGIFYPDETDANLSLIHISEPTRPY